MTTPRRRPAPTFHPVTVADISELTPRMRRITFTGKKLAEYPVDGPATHFKLLLPAPGQTEVTVPQAGPDGPIWPDPRPLRRTYTPRYVDRPGQRLVVDFVLHGDGGPASAWAAAAAVGDRVVVTGARGAYRIDPDADWTLLVADETALPAVGTILDEAPAGAGVLLVAEVADQAGSSCTPGATGSSAPPITPTTTPARIDAGTPSRCPPARKISSTASSPSVATAPRRRNWSIWKASGSGCPGRHAADLHAPGVDAPAASLPPSGSAAEPDRASGQRPGNDRCAGSLGLPL